MKNDKLKWFAAGIGFYIFAPCLESISALVQSIINKSIAHMQMDLEESQCEHQAACEVIAPAEKNSTNAIGFDYDNQGDEYYEE